MNGVPISSPEIRRIVNLRKTGHSLPEIMKLTKRGSSTIFKYTKDIKISEKYINVLKLKQGGSKQRAKNAWAQAQNKAFHLIGAELSTREKLCLIAGIYWGEGSKSELNLINSDPGLIKTFIDCLLELGIKKEDVKINLRLYSDIDTDEAVNFWSKLLTIEKNKIGNIEFIKGKKSGKLQFGMCRVRVAKSATYFKLLMSLIFEVKNQFNAPVVKRI